MKKTLIIATLLVFNSAWGALTLHTDRPVDKMQVMVDAYKQKTGVDVTINSISSFKDLKDEIASKPGDVTIVKDLVYMTDLAQSGLLQPLQSELVKQVVDPSMQTELWTAITYRARTLVYDKSFDVSGINSYADLADPQYAGTLCLRTSKSAYNEGLVASMIKSYGYDDSFDILNGWLNNLVDFNVIYSSDTTIIKEIAKQNGSCTLGITNSYYLGLQMIDNPNIPVGIKYLSLKDGGVSTNGISGAMLAKSQNADQARDFLEFVLSPEMQRYFSNANKDFPANQTVSFPDSIQAWQGFSLNPDSWDTIAEEISAARDLFDELDYL